MVTQSSFLFKRFISITFSVSNTYYVLDVVQPYKLQVHNVFVLRGNVAVLRCQFPAGARISGQTVTWLRDEPLLGRSVIHPGDRYAITSMATMHVRDATEEDTYSKFYCQAKNKVTGERRLSSPGQIVVRGMDNVFGPY